MYFEIKMIIYIIIGLSNNSVTKPFCNLTTGGKIMNQKDNEQFFKYYQRDIEQFFEYFEKIEPNVNRLEIKFTTDKTNGEIVFVRDNENTEFRWNLKNI